MSTKPKKPLMHRGKPKPTIASLTAENKRLQRACETTQRQFDMMHAICTTVQGRREQDSARYVQDLGYMLVMQKQINKVVGIFKKAALHVNILEADVRRLDTTGSCVAHLQAVTEFRDESADELTKISIAMDQNPFAPAEPAG